MSTVQIKLNPKRGQKGSPGVAWVDEEDAHKLGKRKWYLGKYGVYTNQLPNGTSIKKQILLHRLMADVTDRSDLVVRVLDGNYKNCTRKNLQVMTRTALVRHVALTNENVPDNLREHYANKTAYDFDTFLVQATDRGDNLWLWDSALHQRYLDWCDQHGVPQEERLILRDVRDVLSIKPGVRPGMTSNLGMRWNGIGMRETSEEAKGAGRPESALESPKAPPVAVDQAAEAIEKLEQAFAAESERIELLKMREHGDSLELEAMRQVIDSLRQISRMEDGEIRIKRVLKYVADQYGINLGTKLGIFGQVV